MIDKMIKRYVNEVVKYLPILDRRQARMVITATIYERLEEYTNGLRPIRRDVKAVLRELGAPAKVAYAYYDDFHVPFRSRLNTKNMLEYMMRIISVLALVLVVLGMGQLLLGSSNIGILVAGVGFGIVTMFYQMISQVREDSMTFGFTDSWE